MALQIRSNVPAPQPSMIHRRKKMGWTRPGEGIIARSFREEANRGPAPGGPLRIDVGALSPLPWAWRPFSIIFLVFFTPWIQRKHTARHVTSSPGVRDSLPRPRTTSRSDQGCRTWTTSSCTSPVRFPKNLLQYSSHRIFRNIHEVLNEVEKNY